MKKALAFLLVCLMLVPSLAPLAGAAASTDGLHGLSFDNPNEPHAHRAVVSPADLLTMLVGSVPASAEADYLNHYYGESLTYTDGLPDTLVSVKQTDEGELTVWAEPYEYTSSNGRRVVWLPMYALCDGQRKSLSLTSDERYTAVFDGLEGVATVIVAYHGSLSLSAATVNGLINFAYDDAVRGKDAAAAVLAYETAKAEHAAYITALLEYSVKKKEYDTYVKAKEEYDVLLAAYRQNQKDWEAYQTQKAAYDAYVLSQEQYYRDLETYRTDYAKYEQSVGGYNAYLTNLTVIRASMAAMESLYTKPEGYNSLFHALQNAELVTMFEKYQGILTANFSVPASDIKNLRVCSDRLNELLRQYDEKRQISEQEAFLFYKQYYREICDRFNYLYDEMTEIMTPSIYVLMCGKLERDYGKELGAYKQKRIKIVLSHIYRICLCLDDKESAADTWSFFNDEGDPHTYYFADLLDKRVIIADTNASDPFTLTWMDEVLPLTPPTLPTAPTPVQKPVAPATLKEPTEPKVVTEPIKPTFVAEPPKAPSSQTYSLMEQTQMIREAEAAGILARRQEVSESVRVSLSEKCVSKSISLVEATSVGTAYYPSADGSETLSEPFFSLKELPTPPSEYRNVHTVYTFRGWSVSSTEYLPPTEMVNGLSLYAMYTSAKREYRVTFVVEGEEPVTQTYSYGDQPVYPNGEPTKAQTNEYDYTFSTWSPPLRSVTEDMIYEAVFVSEERRYSVTFAVNEEESYTVFYRYGETPVAPVTPISYLDGTTYYAFEGWTPELTAVTGQTTYRASYRQIPLATLPDQTEGTLTLTVSPAAYTLTVSGERVGVASLAGLANGNGKRLELCFSDHNVSFSVSDDTVSSLWRMGVASAVLLLEEGPEGRGVGICFLDDRGNLLRPNGEIRLRIEHGLPDDAKIFIRGSYDNGFYTNDLPAATTGGVSEVIASVGVYYKTVRKYALTVLPSENGTVLSEQSFYFAGETVKLSLYPNGEFRLESLRLRNKTTDQTWSLPSAAGLTMPDGDVELFAVFVPVEYTVQFLYHGGSVSAQYRMGEEVEIPEIPASFEENGFFYAFLGWSAPVTMVTGDAVYTAKYYSVRAEEVSDSGDTGNTWLAILRRVVLPVGGAVLGIVTAITVPTVILVKRWRKKYPKKNAKKKTKKDRT